MMSREDDPVYRATGMERRGSLDQVSLAIGETRSDIKALGEKLDKHCDDDDRRHTENIAVLKDMAKAMEPLAVLAVTVARISPIVDGLQTTRIRLGVIATIFTLLMGAVAWLAEQAISHLLKRLFGA